MTVSGVLRFHHHHVHSELVPWSHPGEAMLNRNMKGISNTLLSRQQINMVLQKFSAITGVPSSIQRNWPHIAVRTFPLIVGAMALTTTLLFGSFLWGYISRKTKHSREKPQPFKDLYPHASHKPNTVITVHDFTKSMEPPSPLVKDFDNNAYFDTLVFDPEQDYAQVLAEARSHAATQMSISANPVPRTKAPWVSRSHSARHHNPFLEDLEAMFPQHKDTKFHDRFKHPKSWKKLMFWKKTKKDNGVEFEMGNGVLSSCTTPLHHAFKSKMRATVTLTTTTNGIHTPRTKRAISGPVYSDGIPYIPASRAGRPCSGPLSGSSTPSREGLYESPYIALKKPGSGGGVGMGIGSSHKSPSGPLYVT